MIGAVDAVDQAIRDVDRLITTGYQGQLSRVLREAETALAKRLAGIVRRNGGTLPDKFTPAQLEAFREQIGMLAAYTQQRLEGLTDEQARSVIDKSIATTVDVMGRLEGRYQGAARPVDIQSATRMSAIAGRTDASLLRDRKRSWERYGSAMVGDFERSMRIGLSQGRSNAEMISQLITVAPKDIAQQLHDAEPRYFPDPKAGFVARQYWAERIVRTEMANASNEANQQTMKDSQRQFPDLKRKILAVGDKRTADDSIYVHGQIRGMNEHFVDGAGRSYLRPPARPNDRETIIPWRDSWEETSVTRQHTPAEISELEARAEKFRESRKKPKPAKPAKPAKKPKPAKPAKQPKAAKPKPPKPSPKPVAVKPSTIKPAVIKPAKLPPAPKPGPPLAKPPKETPAPALPNTHRPEWQYERLKAAGYTDHEATAAAWGHAMLERGKALPMSTVEREIQALRATGWAPPCPPGYGDTKAGDVLEAAKTRPQHMYRPEFIAAEALHASAVVAHHQALRSEGPAAPPPAGLIPASQVFSRATFDGDAAITNKARSSAEAFYRVVGSKSLLAQDGLTITASAASGDRGYYSETARKIVYADPTVLVHELGHAVDNGSRTRAAGGDRHNVTACQAFVLRRTGDRLPREMGYLLPGSAYDPGEEAYPDEFLHAYVGKPYLGPWNHPVWVASEVFSMGVQNVYENGANLASKDPEHYALTLGLLAGRH